MDFHIELTLKQLAMVPYVASLWNRPYIQEKLLEPTSDGAPTDKLHFLINLVKEELKALPYGISTQVISAIVSMGVEAFHWLQQTKNQLNISSQFFDRIKPPLQWTIYGTIDQAKLETKLVTALEAADELDKGSSTNFGLYYMACSCVQKDFIIRHAQEMYDFCQTDSRRFRRKRNRLNFRKVDFILHSVLFFARGKIRLDERRGEFEEVLLSRQANMFLLSVDRGSIVAVRYYWNLLDSEEKNNKLMRAAFEWILAYKEKLEDIPCSPGRKNVDYHMDVIIFLLQQMPEYQVELFFLSIGDKNVQRILVGIIHSSSWEELFFPPYDLIKTVRSGDVGHFLHSMFDEILSALACNYELGVECKNTTCHKMFFTLWEDMKKSDEKFEPTRLFSYYNGYVLPGLYKGFDIRILNLVLGLEEDRKKSLGEGKIYFKELIRKCRYDLIEEFMKVVLISKEERTWFIKNQLDFTLDFLIENNFEAVEKILDWRGSFEEKVSKDLVGINDVFEVCAKLFVERKRVLAKKVLNWRFSNDKEKKERVNNFYPDKLTFLQTIWDKRGPDLFIKTLSEFIAWFTGKDSDFNKLVKEKIINENVLDNFLNNEQIKKTMSSNLKNVFMAKNW